MRYGRIEGVDKPVSRVVCGTAFKVMLEGGDASELLDRAVACGINAFDCAENYGKAEISLGDWLKGRNDRERLVIETKGCHPDFGEGWVRSRVTKEALDRDLAQSLDRLHTGYVDIYMLHRDDPDVPAGEIVEWLNEHHRKGEIRAFGGSNWSCARIAEANRYAAEHDLTPFTVSSPNFSLAVEHENPWVGEGVTIGGGDHAADRDWYRGNGMAVFAYSALARGFMTGMFPSSDRASAECVLDKEARKGFLYDDNFERLHRTEQLAGRKGATVAQIAVAWLFHQGMNVFALLSCTSLPIIEANAGAADIDLTDEECAWLNLDEAR